MAAVVTTTAMAERSRIGSSRDLAGEETTNRRGAIVGDTFEGEVTVDRAEMATEARVKPLKITEHLHALEQAIDSLRANLRAAHDETSMMDPTDSVIVVVNAVSQANEHIERARTRHQRARWPRGSARRGDRVRGSRRS
jgi:hypothetical protein